MTKTNNTPRHASLRLPAEWEPQLAVLIAWPHEYTDWAPRLSQVDVCYQALASAIAPRVETLYIVTPEPERVKALIPDIANARVIELPTNDTWTRDYGPISTRQGADGALILNDFQFNGWGLKFAADCDNLVSLLLASDPDMPFSAMLYKNMRSFVLEGGSIESDGEGTILTTAECLLSPNRNGGLEPGEIEMVLRGSLGAKRVLWLRHGALEGDDTDSHVDTLARLLPGGVIAYSSCDRPDDSHFAELSAMEAELQELRQPDGKPYRLVSLPIPEPIYDEDGDRLPATYANFLILNGAILLPVYADERYDALAIERIRQAAPGYEIVTVDCRELIRQHGSLHCATMQIPR